MVTASKRDYYEVLGVPRNATLDQIKKAYRRLARKHHPDVNPGDRSAEARFKEISEAYHVLSDKERRARYDQFGHQAFAGPHGEEFDFGGFDFSTFDLGGLGDLFGDLFGRRSRRARAEARTSPTKGNDIHYSLEISFDDAFRGFSTQISLNKLKPCGECRGTGVRGGGESAVCSECNGTGEGRGRRGPILIPYPCPRCGGSGRVNLNPCSRCGGSGKLQGTEFINVKIPPGVDTGSRVRLAGKGEPGNNGGPPGDLYIITKVRPHPSFERKGDNLYCEVPITITEAALGAKIEIRTPEDISRMTVPPGTESGQRFRLQGKGMPRLKGAGRGDLFVTVKITLPKFLDERSKQLLRDFERLNPMNPRARTVR